MAKYDPVFIEQLCNVTWYTADRKSSYLVKASASINFGYAILITDLESTYFCAANVDTLFREKKKFNPTIETDDQSKMINLLHEAISKHDHNASYHIHNISDDELHFKLQKQLDIYPFKWEFQCFKIPQADHMNILRNFLVAPLISTVNSLENKYQILLKKHQGLEAQYKEKLFNEHERMKFQTFQNDHQIWNKSISADEIIINEFPQLKTDESVQHVMTQLQQKKFFCKKILSYNNFLQNYLIIIQINLQILKSDLQMMQTLTVIY